MSQTASTLLVQSSNSRTPEVKEPKPKILSQHCKNFWALWDFRNIVANLQRIIGQANNHQVTIMITAFVTSEPRAKESLSDSGDHHSRLRISICSWNLCVNLINASCKP